MGVEIGVQIELIHDVTDEIVAAFARLMPQLSSDSVALGAEALARIVSWTGNHVLIARVDGSIAGVLTLATFPIPSGLRARIEDVVVDTSARGRGVGAGLTREAVRIAFAAGARTVDLTSRPSREAANRLYERIGFTRRVSHVYRLDRAAYAVPDSDVGTATS